MTNPKTMKRVLRSSLTLALALAIWSPVQAQNSAIATAVAPASVAAPPAAKNAADAKMFAQCEDIMAQKQKMADDAKTQGIELSALVTKMNSAAAGKKVDEIAAVVTRMVEQRFANDAQKAKMDEEMKQHMTAHMKMGKESMGMCPMVGMKNMNAMNDDTAVDPVTEAPAPKK